MANDLSLNEMLGGSSSQGPPASTPGQTPTGINRGQGTMTYKKAMVGGSGQAVYKKKARKKKGRGRATAVYAGGAKKQRRATVAGAPPGYNAQSSLGLSGAGYSMGAPANTQRKRGTWTY